MKKYIFALLFIFLILTPIAANQYYKYQLRPVSQSTENKIFIIKPGQPLTQIAQNLQKAGLIKNALMFRFYVEQSGIAKTIQAGDFRIAPSMSAKDIAQQLTHGAIDVWITFPEGRRVEEMAQIIENSLKTQGNDEYSFDKNEFIKTAKEGHMFPDTYLIAKDATAKDIVERLENTFDQKVDKKTLLSGIKNNLTQDQVIVLASIVEREAKTNEERPIIAGILINRLKIGMPLQDDPTVRYAIGYDSSSNSWWNPPVNQDDIANTKSFYNTYLHTGLPPAPICNPGIDSIEAAANPTETDYMYFLEGSDGKIHYAKTGEEHQQNVQKYL